MKNRFKEALEDFNTDGYDADTPCWVDAEKMFRPEICETIRFALKGMDALMAEPTQMMMYVGTENLLKQSRYGTLFSDHVWKEMRDQLLKDIENEETDRNQA